jgi:carbon monoxide dehydrogenase subunit G
MLPLMGQAEVDIDIKAAPDKVWAVISDFGGLDKWLPGVDSCRQEGDDRHLEMMNMNITEHLVKKDDAGKQLIYGITDGVPIEHHQATITVSPAGDGSKVTWLVDTDDAMTEMMSQIYQQGLVALKEHVES